MKWQQVMVVSAAALLCVAAGVVLQNPEVERKQVQQPDDPEPFTIEPVLAIEVERLNQPQALPASLAGTSHGVKLLTRHDELLVTASLRDLFDYYLSSLGEASVDVVQQLIQVELQRQLQGPALQDALNILTNYLSYKQALRTFEQDYQADPDHTRQQQLVYMQERQQALIALQDRELGSRVAAVFFAFDRQMDDNTLARAAILNSDLTAEGKEQALINLQAEQPIQQQLQQQRDHQQRRLLEIDQAELTAEEKYLQRAETVGEGAAQRLAQLDQQRAQWQQRVNEFRQELQQLKPILAEEDYQQQYQQLLEQKFEPHERLRAKALVQ